MPAVRKNYLAVVSGPFAIEQAGVEEPEALSAQPDSHIRAPVLEQDGIEGDRPSGPRLSGMESILFYLRSGGLDDRMQLEESSLGRS